MEEPKQVENQSQAEPKQKYEKPIIMELGELTSGAGAAFCHVGSGNATCGVGNAALDSCATGVGL